MRTSLTKAWAGAAALAVAVSAALPASALTILPGCQVDRFTGIVYYDGGVPASGVPGPLTYDTVGPGVVGWEYLTTGNRGAAVIQSCSNGRELWIQFPASGQDVARATLADMAFGATAYTLRDIRRTMNVLGADTRNTRGNFGQCVCSLLGL